MTNIIERFLNKISGEEETLSCECGGKMKKVKSLPGDEVMFVCQECNSKTDGVKFYPSDEFNREYPDSRFSSDDSN